MLGASVQVIKGKGQERRVSHLLPARLGTPNPFLCIFHPWSSHLPPCLASLGSCVPDQGAGSLGLPDSALERAPQVGTRVSGAGQGTSQTSAHTRSLAQRSAASGMGQLASCLPWAATASLQTQRHKEPCHLARGLSSLPSPPCCFRPSVLISSSFFVPSAVALPYHGEPLHLHSSAGSREPLQPAGNLRLGKPWEADGRCKWAVMQGSSGER